MYVEEQVMDLRYVLDRGSERVGKGGRAVEIGGLPSACMMDDRHRR